MKIAVYCEGGTWGDVNPDTLKLGMGGRETAAVQLAMQWGLLGHDVTVFAPNEAAQHREAEGGGKVAFLGTEYAPAFLSAMPYDVVLSWEQPTVFGIPMIKQWGALTVCGMQVAHIDTQVAALQLVDLWVALSDWARSFLALQILPGSLVAVQPNCVDSERYATERPSDNYEFHPDKAYRFLYASSPDRGLAHALRTWPLIRKELPNAELHVVYGARDWAEKLKWAHYLPGEMAVEILATLDQPGVVDHGKIGQDALADLHYASDFLWYPADTINPTETGCITVMEALAAGNVPITTDCDCLLTEFGAYAAIQPLPFDEQEWARHTLSVVRDERLVRTLKRRGRDFVMRERTWDIVAPQWIEMFEQAIAEREEPLSEERAIVTA